MIKLVSFFGLGSTEFDFVILPKISYQLKLSKYLKSYVKYKTTFTDLDIILRDLCS